MSITVFLTNGETLQFSQVTELELTDEYFVFSYYGLTSGEHRRAIFHFNQIAGFAHTDATQES